MFALFVCLLIVCVAVVVVGLCVCFLCCVNDVRVCMCLYVFVVCFLCWSGYVVLIYGLMFVLSVVAFVSGVLCVLFCLVVIASCIMKQRSCCVCYDCFVCGGLMCAC